AGEVLHRAELFAVAAAGRGDVPRGRRLDGPAQRLAAAGAEQPAAVRGRLELGPRLPQEILMPTGTRIAARTPHGVWCKLSGNGIYPDGRWIAGEPIGAAMNPFTCVLVLSSLLPADGGRLVD